MNQNEMTEKALSHERNENEGVRIKNPQSISI